MLRPVFDEATELKDEVTVTGSRAISFSWAYEEIDINKEK
jgi:hypothetical protein